VCCCTPKGGKACPLSTFVQLSSSPPVHLWWIRWTSWTSWNTFGGPGGSGELGKRGGLAGKLEQLCVTPFGLYSLCPAIQRSWTSFTPVGGTTPLHLLTNLTSSPAKLDKLVQGLYRTRWTASNSLSTLSQLSTKGVTHFPPVCTPVGGKAFVPLSTWSTSGGSGVSEAGLAGRGGQCV
jgi:hypothetical protein